MSRETKQLLKPLTKRDLDERIGRLATELFSEGDRNFEDPQDWAPVEIEPAEFVRRMRPFMVYN